MEIKDLLKYIADHSKQISFNTDIMEISEGALKKHMRIALNQQFASEKNVNSAMQRCAPINIWNKIVRKLSRVYANDPRRRTENESDLELIHYYEDLGVNRALSTVNYNYNNYKWSSLEIYEDIYEERIGFRVPASNMFLPYSDDKINPLRVTGIIKFMGMSQDKNGNVRSKYWYYTDTEFWAFLDNGDLVMEDMIESEGENPFDVIPFEYVSMSNNFLVPLPDEDTKQMTINTGVLLTDMNFASMYLSIPILAGINIDADNLPQSPNAFWNVKQADPDGGAPDIRVIKPEPDLAGQINNVKDQLAMWLESRDIKPGSVGTLNGENFSSGISKIISEMDTIENRNAQKVVFADFETSFWRRLATIHNTLAKEGRISNRQVFSDPETLKVDVEFVESAVIESRADKVLRLKEEVDNRFKSRKAAMKELNPTMTDSEIDKEIMEIDEERTVTITEEANVPNEES